MKHLTHTPKELQDFVNISAAALGARGGVGPRQEVQDPDKAEVTDLGALTRDLGHNVVASGTSKLSCRLTELGPNGGGH